MNLKKSIYTVAAMAALSNIFDTNQPPIQRRNKYVYTKREKLTFSGSDKPAKGQQTEQLMLERNVGSKLYKLEITIAFGTAKSKLKKITAKQKEFETFLQNATDEEIKNAGITVIDETK